VGEVGEGKDAMESAGDCVALKSDLIPLRRKELEGDDRPLDSTGCLSVDTARSNDEVDRSVGNESLAPPLSSSFNFSGSSSKSTKFFGA
jgi:hypothetical protein